MLDVGRKDNALGILKLASKLAKFSLITRKNSISLFATEVMIFVIALQRQVN